VILSDILGGNPRSQVDIDRTLGDIRKLKDANNTDRQIMDILAIPIPTYRRYVQKIHKQNKEAWLSVSMNEYETELLKLKGSLEDTYRKAKALSEDQKRDSMEILEACSAKDDARLSIVTLLTEGPEMIAKVEGLLSENKKKRKMDTKREDQEEVTTT
jgi:Tfp pilus assembly protein PilE